MRTLRLGLLLLALRPAFAAERSPFGMVEGLVEFPGEPPAPALIVTLKAPECPRAIPQTHLQVRKENRGLQGAIVTLQAAPQRLTGSVAITLSSKGCRFDPPVQWVRAGGSLVMRRQDGADHRLLVDGNGVRTFEVDLDAGQPAVRRPLLQPGLYRVSCARHLWERAWIYASPHPYAAVTDEEGRFRIAGVPPGRYDLRVWHAGWEEGPRDAEGRLSYQPVHALREVAVRARQTTTLRIDRLIPLVIPD